MIQHPSHDSLNSLRERVARFKADNPKLRIRNVADALGVSEVELVALNCGDSVTSVTRLRSDPESLRQLMAEMRTLGSVMALSRNDSVVHEKTGVYGKLAGGSDVGLFLGEIDLRIFFKRWAFAYHVAEGERRSLQFFDQAGTAVHKVYANADTDIQRLDQLVTRYRVEEQSAGQYIDPELAAQADQRVIKPTQVDTDVDLDDFRADWDQLKDVHDFSGLLKKHNVERKQAFRLAGEERAKPLPVEVLEQALEKAAQQKLPIMLFVGNTGIVQIHTGPVNKLVRMGPWYNVLDPGFNLHANTETFSEAWLVRRPTEDGVVSSLEFFDQQGYQVLQLFGARKPGQKELTEWQALLETLERSGEAESI
ncbi:hemin-degrading factor [Oceanospirillum sp.]|uniref:hemin-degrading factor n=1 Tax=Oceanospirillum sp. TaxID=2021254 RepID=UPI003A938336